VSARNPGQEAVQQRADERWRVVPCIYKRGGKVTVTQTAIVSSDGKTLTITSTGANFQGMTVNTVTVYDKQ
jgi:hypothetical protein